MTTSAIDAYKVTPRQTRGFVIDVLMAGLVPFVQSSPGMGKSSIMRSIAHEMNLKLIDHRLSTSAPEDLSGLPKFLDDGSAVFAPFKELFPLTDSDVPSGKDGWMLFMDEFNSAPKAVQAASYKVILDKMVGQHSLHERVVITAAGNLATDRAIVNSLSTAMQSRVIHLDMVINFPEWLEDVALKEGYDSRIIAYLSQYESKLMDFKPDHKEKTFCCPRTWEFVNKLIQGKEINNAMAPLLCGTITSGVAIEFIQYAQVFRTLITVRQIIADPLGAPLPADLNARWATVSHMMEKVDKDTFDPLAQYADRFDMPMRILFYRSALVRHPELRREPAFLRGMSTLNRYLNGA